GSGWTSLASINLAPPQADLVYRVADGTEGSSVTPFTGYQSFGGDPNQGNVVWVVELYNVASVSPILSTANVVTNTDIGVTINDLLIVFGWAQGLGQYSVPPITGVQSLGLMFYPSRS